ncbi:helix-turn-helix domain-containing protein [Microbispora tritici]|uniref:Helix-turn-helix domain-containing protein n=4 Tax=Streptosporangiaceae TaxID=2004 RepID=A0ABY3LSM6_9ACTN|nr:helix-turn-helix domain-containing protein [Microbispora cellulosiformans]TLP57879.1 helix-turn-helix domain-containing protein [Microbispora fusca]TYB52347.1 helix-turn-helix domain-containing protein [Microbispora tritici]
MTSPMRAADLGDLPAVIDVVTAGRLLGFGRTKAYQLAKNGEFPCRVLRIGRSYLVPTREVWALLGYHDDGTRRPDTEEG